MEITICFILLYCDTSLAVSLSIYFSPMFLTISKIIWSAYNYNYARTKFKVIFKKISDFSYLDMRYENQIIAKGRRS